jgi:hypothetical protein
MLKRLIKSLGILGLLVGLVACRSPEPATLRVEPSATPVASTPTPVADTPTAVPTRKPSATPEATPTSTREAEKRSTVPTPTRTWQIPEVQERDWVKGGADAGMVLVEYSDFQ